MTNNINYKMKDSINKVTSNNYSNINPINNSNKKNSINFNSVIKNLSTSPDTKPWYKKKASIIAMSSTLGVGVLATAIAVPVVLLTVNNNSGNLPLTPEQLAKIDEFNAKPLNDKITSYNNIVTNVSYIAAIQKHFLDYKITGLYNFFLANIDGISSSSIDNYNLFKTFLETSSTSSDSSPFLKSHIYSTNNNNAILNIIGVGNSVESRNLYFTMFFTTSTTFASASMYSPIASNIVNLTLDNDFSIKISFNTNAIENSMYALNIAATNTLPFSLSYKQDIVFNNSTLFPGMQDYVKNAILTIV